MPAMKRLLDRRRFTRQATGIFLVVLLTSILTTPVHAACGWLDDFVGNDVNGTVNALTVWNGNLYAGGDFTTAGGVTVNGIAKFNGTNWSALTGTLGIGVAGGSVKALLVWNGALYVGGTFTTAGGTTVNGIAKWDGADWSALSTGIGGDLPEVWALATYNGDLYAGGTFTFAGGVPAQRVAKWNGTAWAPLASGVDLHVWALKEWNGSLYATGHFTNANGISANYIAEWNGADWANLPAGESNGLTNDGLAMTTWNDPLDASPNPALYIGGWFGRVGAPSTGLLVNRITKWDGTFHQLTGPSTAGFPFLSNCYSLTTWDDGDGTDLYAGGNFPTAGGVNVNGIASWDGDNWSALLGASVGMSPEGSIVYALTTWNDGTGVALYAGGDFTTAGGVVNRGVAKYSCGASIPDTTPPTNPTTLASTSHTVGVPSAATTITMTWSGAVDTESGLNGYSVEFDQEPSTQPNSTVDVAQTTDPHGTSSATLTEGEWYFHLSSCDVVANCSVAEHIGPFVIDTTGPIVTGYDTVAYTPNGLTANEATARPITQILVSFNEDLDAVAAQNIGNWTLVSAGANGAIDSICTAIGDDLDIGVTAATLLGDLRTVRLDVGDGFSLPAGLYRISACSGITDALGNAMVNTALNFTLKRDNVIPNPNFDDETAPWIAGGSRPQDLGWNSGDAEGKATSGSLEVATASGAGETTSAETCIDVPGGLPTGLSGFVEVTGGGGTNPSVTLELIASSAAGCATASATSTKQIAAGATDWQGFVLSPPTPPTGEWTSMLIRFTVAGGASSTHTVRFDVLEEPIFVDGFETGDTVVWSAQVP